MDYLKIKIFDLVAHVPFIRFLEAINWLWVILLNQTILNMMHGSIKTSTQWILWITQMKRSSVIRYTLSSIRCPLEI